MNTNYLLNNFNRDDFLQNYWQKKPLLIRNALPGFINPLSPDELAGLACEDRIESRIIRTEGKSWELEHGPFTEQRFNTLPERAWTLLVQAVDHYIPEVAELIEYFRFIPNWRIDDVMVSYACTGGSVGPHYDNYDVFLIQGAGQRQWQLGQSCTGNDKMLPHDQLQLLEDFECQQEWLLEAGDILYVPPLCAHWGTGKDDQCMTYSIGFRAPSHAEILSNFCDTVLSKLDDRQRFSDTNLSPQANPGELSEPAIARVKAILQEYLGDENQIREWFGSYMTEPKYPLDETADEDVYSVGDVSERVDQGGGLLRDSAARFAYHQQGDTVVLFVNGRSYSCKLLEGKLAMILCSQSVFPAETLHSYIADPNAGQLLLALINQGSLYFDDEN